MTQIAIVGDLNSSWWRCMRFLLDDGKPLPPLIRLGIGPVANGRFPFGALCKTTNNRLIFWQPLEKRLPTPTVDHPHVITDHITLDLWSGKSHPTWYDANDARTSPEKSLGWKMEPLDGSELTHWFSMLIQTAIIEEQDVEVHADVRVQANDEARRIEEFKKHWSNSALADIVLPPSPNLGNYLCCSFFVVTGDISWPINDVADFRTMAHFMSRLPLWQQVQYDGPAKPCCPQANFLDIGGTRLVIVTACPGGTLVEKNILGVSSCSSLKRNEAD